MGPKASTVSVSVLFCNVHDSYLGLVDELITIGTGLDIFQHLHRNRARRHSLICAIRTTRAC